MITMQKRLKTLEEGKNEFIVDCKIRNLADDTIVYYEECFGYFIKFIHEMYQKIDIQKDINKTMTDNYILYMKNQKLKDTTINLRIRGIRSFLYYLMRNNYIENFEIKLIKQNQVIPNLYTDEEIKRLIKKPNIKTCTFTEFRGWVIVNFLVATGVRSRTLRNIKIGDLDFDNDLIYLTTTKGRKEIIIPMGNAIKKILLEYLQIRGNKKEDYLFCSVTGKQLTQNALNHSISNYNKKRNVGKTGIHLLRHFFAKSYIQNGGNSLKLQKLLGHRTLEQTKTYVDLFGKDLQTDFGEFSPLDNLCADSERIKMRVS